MFTRLKSIALGCLLLFSTASFAFKDPISWSLNQVFPVPVLTIGGSYNITYTFINQLPFKLVKPILITKNASPASEFTYTDACSGLYLSPQQSCTVSVMLDPLVVGTKFVQLSIAGYSNDVVPLPVVTTVGTGQTPVSVSGIVSQGLPANTDVGVPNNYSFTFTNNGSATATGVSVQFSNPSSTTCSTTLAAGASCTVSGVYTAQSSTPSSQSVSVTFSYTQGTPLTVSTTTNVSDQIVRPSFVAPDLLPLIMVGGPTNTVPVTILFTNISASPVTIDSRSVLITGGAGATYTIGGNPGDDSCAGTPILPPNAACQIVGVFEAPVVVTPTAYTLTASVDYTQGSSGTASIAASTSVVTSISSSRTLEFENQCNFPVWFSLNGGALGGTSCTGGCPAGTTCNNSTGNCYWNNYAPADGIYELDAAGGGHSTNTVTIPETTADPAGVTEWSGNFSASTLCNGSSTCGQATCGNNGGSTACAVGTGFSQPATQAEITMLLNGVDSYDVEVINGFHIPIKMTPDPFVAPSNYYCGEPGNEVSSNGFGACSWSGAVAPSNPYFWVTSGGSSCNTASPSCPAGQKCGLDSGLNPVCGNFLGYWTANQACGVNATKAQPYFGCNNYLSSPFPANQYTYYQLMACSVPTGSTSPLLNSCYNAYPSYTSTEISQCCGCMDWWTLGIGSNSNTDSCIQSGQSSPQTNLQWNTYIQPTFQWMKQACPSLYVYPFDDKTSTFTCSNNIPGSPNSQGYKITFCAGNTGLPAGITEGRG